MSDCKLVEKRNSNPRKQSRLYRHVKVYRQSPNIRSSVDFHRHQHNHVSRLDSYIGSFETLTLFVGKQSHFVETHTLYSTHNTGAHKKEREAERSDNRRREMQQSFKKCFVVSQRPNMTTGHDRRSACGSRQSCRKILNWIQRANSRNNNTR